MIRRGISLLEVLISIGVVSIGLLGVAALIPVAQFKAQQGILEDRKAAYGRRALAEFRIRGMNAPGTTLYGTDMSAANWRWPTWPRAGASQRPVFSPDGSVLRQSYCLDPRMVATARTGGQPDLVQAFPSRGLTVAMPRITLGTLWAPDPAVMQALADEAFVLPDDLVFQVPTSRPELPPLLQYLAPNGVPVKPYAEGKLSWMATLVPVQTSFGSVPEDDDDRYVLSVVIFNERVLDPTEESVATVTTLGPGEIRLGDATATRYGIKDLRVGDWLMLARRVTVPHPLIRNYLFTRWTQVINADENFDVANEDREFTISLSDMPATHAVFVKGVVAVYERTVRLENSTLWN
jgi:type II secretory pathway pseudopilin PulG